MKKRFVSTLLTLAAVLTGDCLAVYPVTEDFSASLDSFKWYQFKPTSARLVPANGKLNFVVRGTPKHTDFASIELLYNQAYSYEDWEMIVDFSNTAKRNSHTGCGFMIFDYYNRGNYIYVNYYSSYGIDAGVFRSPGSGNSMYSPAPALSKRAVTPIGAVRVLSDPLTGVMTFFSSAKSKEEGYVWKAMGTFSPDSNVAADVVSDWGAVDGGTYGFQLFGAADSSKVPLGKVTIDNFSLQSTLR